MKPPQMTFNIAKLDINSRVKKKQFEIQGRRFTLYSLGWLASMCHRDVHTLRRYEYAKVLPKPILKTADNQRWYLPQEILGYAMLIKQANLRPSININTTGLPSRLFAEKERLLIKASKVVKAPKFRVKVIHTQSVKQSQDYQSTDASYGIEITCEDSPAAIQKALDRAEHVVEHRLIQKIQTHRQLLKSLRK